MVNLARGSVFVAVMIFTTINLLAVFFASTLNVSNVGDVVVNALFDKDTFSTTNPEINPQLEGGLQKDLQGTADSGLLSVLVDGLKKVFGFLVTLLTLGFAIFNMFLQSGAPLLITYVVGMPIAIGFYIAIASAIRGFSI